MSFSLAFEESRQVLLGSFSELVTDEILLNSYQLVRNWIEENGQYCSIADFTAVTSFEVTPQAVRQLAASSPLLPNSFTRIVVAPKDEIFGMARMFEILGSANREGVRVVRTLSEAFAALGIDAPSLRTIHNL